jgi:hypothetical protein
MRFLTSVGGPPGLHRRRNAAGQEQTSVARRYSALRKFFFYLHWQSTTSVVVWRHLWRYSGATVWRHPREGPQRYSGDPLASDSLRIPRTY